jgi:Fe2+ transport system protein B
VASKPMLLVASRVDAAGEGDRLIALREFCRELGKPLYEISCVTGEGLEELKWATWTMLEQIPRPGPEVDTTPVNHA